MIQNYKSVNKIFQESFSTNWEHPALSNFGGENYSYGDIARKIAQLHLVFDACGIKKGDRVSLCSRNQANWAVSFLSVLTYGAVPVPILHEFKAASVHNLVCHSQSRILFADEPVWNSLDLNEMPSLELAVNLDNLSMICSTNDEVKAVFETLEEKFAAKYPTFGPADLNYYEDQPEELAVINYTSGTSGFSKGVMIPYRALWSNIQFGVKVMGWLKPGHNILSMLPCAHMYGLMFETLFELTCGVHIHYLTRVPSPKIIMEAMAAVKPDLIIAVPLIIEKVYKSKLQPILTKPVIKFAVSYVPFFRKFLYNKMCKGLNEAFGGRFYEVIMGGAAFNKEVEAVFHDMKFRYTVGYGMTECAPIISYADFKEARVGSSGYAAPNMEIRIKSKDPQNIPGEIQVRGANVFLGYYNNEEATAEVFTEDGWFRTGDMGVLDKDGFLFIKGRNKCMILGPSGQNIYPEELETVLNNVKYVVDTLVVENPDGPGLKAFVYPDYVTLMRKKELKKKEVAPYIEAKIKKANKELPSYAQIKVVEVLENDFERTPKKSIKRYLYSK